MTAAREVFVTPHRHYAGFWSDENRLTRLPEDQPASPDAGAAGCVEIFTIPGRLMRGFEELDFSTPAPGQNPDGYEEFCRELVDFLVFIDVAPMDRSVRIDVRRADSSGQTGDVPSSPPSSGPCLSINMGATDRFPTLYPDPPGHDEHGYRIRQRPGEGLLLPPAGYRYDEASTAGDDAGSEILVRL